MTAEFHEPRERLSKHSLDIKRAIDSMRAELEAIEWYRQRMQVASSQELRDILDHHQREEVEHFAMLLEWCRRTDADFAEMLREYLFTDRPILEVEEVATGEGNGGGGGGSLDREMPRTAGRRRTIGRIDEENR